MVSLTVLVTSQPVNQENIGHIRSLFQLSRAFSGMIKGPSSGATIMMRDMGVRVPRGQKLSLSEKNELRQSADAKQRQTVTTILNEVRLNFSERDLLVPAQPTFDDPDLYWKPVDDFLVFAASIASTRARISGQILLNLFDEVKPSILAIEDFSNPSLPFENIVANVTRRYLKTATDFALNELETEINGHLSGLNSGGLRGGLNIKFVTNLINERRHQFEVRVEELLPHLADYSPAETDRCRKWIEDAIQKSCRRLFVDRCLLVVVPELQNEIIDNIKNQIDFEANRLSIDEISLYSFTDLSRRYEDQAASQLRTGAINVHAELVSRAAFWEGVGQIKSNVSEYGKAVERRRRQEYDQHQREEARKRKEKADRRREVQRLRLQREDEARRARERREQAERLRWQREEEERRRLEAERQQRELQEYLESARRRLAAEQERQRRLEEARRAQLARERAEREAEDRRRREEAQRARQREAARQAAIRRRIEYEGAHPPVVYRSSGSGCAVF
jgi:hypothetical protein